MNSHRDTIFLEEAEIIDHQAFEGDQYTLRVRAPEIASHARAGSFAHITCDPQRPMRRPISIMRVRPDSGEVEFLYKAFGEGTALLAKRQIGETLSILGPIGKPFEVHPDRPRPLLIGGGVGMPPMVFVADNIHQQHPDFSPFMILGSEVPFPFAARPSEFVIPGIPAGVVATMPLMEDWNIPCRLASTQGYAGCFEGYVTDLARLWLDALTDEQCQQVEVFACGPHPMLEAVAQLAKEYALPCQVSLEEFMACAVGGCAGCVVEVQTDNGPAMQRVCVDGPVFDAARLFG
jgi:dihydroorotate dehydrogenase electron transfer subunit